MSKIKSNYQNRPPEGAECFRSKMSRFMYYSQDRDRWFGKFNPSPQQNDNRNYF